MSPIRICFKGFLFFCLIFTSCKENKDIENKTPASGNTPTAETISLPPLPADKMQMLYQQCDYTDYIFHNLPFSISQSEKPAIVKNLGFISPDPVGEVSLNCDPMGREFFHINGEIVLEADIYFDENCAYVVFMEGNNPVYLNRISPSGQQFYTSIVAQKFKQ